MAQSEIVKPQQTAGDRHHHRAPHEGPVFNLLGIVEFRELRLYFRESQIVGKHLHQIDYIFRFGQHRLQEQSVSPVYREVNHMVESGNDQYNRRSPMDRSAEREVPLQQQ